ncbi:hypothetical protein ACQJBY_073619 [Aegilops geniculata]
MKTNPPAPGSRRGRARAVLLPRKRAKDYGNVPLAELLLRVKKAPPPYVSLTPPTPAAMPRSPLPTASQTTLRGRLHLHRQWSMISKQRRIMKRRKRMRRKRMSKILCLRRKILILMSKH